jgi:hypothetical protein
VRHSREARRVGEFPQTFAHHLEEADFTRRTESVLLCAQQAQRAVAIAFDANYRVDEVLKRARPGEFAVFRDVANEHQRRTVVLRHGAETLGGVAHLGHRTDDARERVVAHRRDRVDHAEVSAAFTQQRRCANDAGRRCEFEGRGHGPETSGPSRDLGAGLFGGDEQDVRGTSGHRAQRHQGQRRLADTRLTVEQSRGAGDEATTKDAVEFSDARGNRRRRASGTADSGLART